MDFWQAFHAMEAGKTVERTTFPGESFYIHGIANQIMKNAAGMQGIHKVDLDELRADDWIVKTY